MVHCAAYFPKKRILNSFLLKLSGLVIFLFIAAGSYLLENNFLFEKQKFFYVPPANYLKVICGSFRSLCADLFYIRGVLAITQSDEFKNRGDWANWVQKNFETALTLDPKLTQGYFFAGIVIVRDKPEEIKKGISFLENGLKLNSSDWQIPYWIGLNYYQAGDFLKAAEYYQKASAFPDAPQFLKSNQPAFYYKANRPDLGLAYLEGLAHSVKDPEQLKWIEIKLKWFENIVELQGKVEAFKRLYGYPPLDLEKLIEAGLLKEIPADPFGVGYYIDKDSGRVKSKVGKPNSLSKREN